MNLHFASFDFTGQADVQVTIKDNDYNRSDGKTLIKPDDFWQGNAVVRPLSREITPKTERRVVTFSLKQPGQYSVERPGTSGFERKNLRTMMETPTFMPLPEAVVAQLNAVSTATISYQLAKRGLANTFMAGIAPLRPDLRLCGRAVTLRYIPVRADLLKDKKEDTNAQRQLIESIGAGEVLVIDARGTTASATIGNILTTRVQVRGAAGIVSDGCFRDYSAIQAMDFPTYARGRHAAINSTVLLPADINLPIGCGGVAVIPGDVIVGGAEGVIVIPYDIIEEVAADAAEQEQIEDFILQKVRGGASTIGLYPPNENVRAEFRRLSE